MEKFSEWAKTCLRKKKMSESISKKLVSRVNKDEGFEKLRSYYCPHCFSYHVTSKIRNNK